MRMLIPEVGEMRKASEGGTQSIGQPGGLTFDAVEVPVCWNFSLSAGGMPNNLRDLRYRPPKVGAHEPTEVGAGGAKHGPAVWREQALEGIKTSDLGNGPSGPRQMPQGHGHGTMGRFMQEVARARCLQHCRLKGG
ncbi:unnamed protein product [Durusdinium trenchii]|uniref:Uncharacterized protein n=1 Tax=Durusdinium trenchii TaxID=1381693 RepID=A0ABP0QH66_9DINO